MIFRILFATAKATSLVYRIAITSVLIIQVVRSVKKK